MGTDFPVWGSTFSLAFPMNITVTSLNTRIVLFPSHTHTLKLHNASLSKILAKEMLLAHYRCAVVASPEHTTRSGGCCKGNVAKVRESGFCA